MYLIVEIDFVASGPAAEPKFNAVVTTIDLATYYRAVIRTTKNNTKIMITLYILFKMNLFWLKPKRTFSSLMLRFIVFSYFYLEKSVTN